MNYCIYIKKKKGKPFCKLLDKEITLSECNSINAKDKCRVYKTKNDENSFYKNKKIHNNYAKALQTSANFCKPLQSNNHQIRKSPLLKKKSPLKSGKMKNKSNKLAKLERNRFSIIVDDLTKCCIPNCGCTEGINKHEIFYGAYRLTSIKWGLVIPLCPFHHTIGKLAIHNNRALDLYYKRLGQTIFEEMYSHELFIEEFKIDYLKRYKKRGKRQLV